MEFGLRAKMAADWLCRIQEPDGNIPPIINPISGRAVRQIDWPRLAFCAWSLAEFGKAAKEEKYIQSAQKSFEYLNKYLLNNDELRTANYELTLAYFGELALALGKQKDALLAAEKILARFGSLMFEPITFAQIASFFKIVAEQDGRFFMSLEDLCKILKENFESNLKSKRQMNLAYWAELANTFSEIDQEFSEKTAVWLKKQQLPGGAFPWLSQSIDAKQGYAGLVYTRAVSKIFEVLALDPKRNEEAIKRALTWLFSMQYNKENTLFVSPEIMPRVLGGFRYDYLKQEAWIDAAGHLLLGVARLIQAKVVWK